MPEAATPTERIGVRVRQDMALLQVEGRGSFRVGGSVKEFARAITEEGVRTLVVDLRYCVGMDSTFMGIVAGLSIFYRKLTPPGRVLLVNVSEKNLALLRTLGIDRLVKPYAEGDAPQELTAILPVDASQVQTLPRCDETARQTTSTMLEAHEDLVAAVPDNRAKFKDVVAFLREDLKRETD